MGQNSGSLKDDEGQMKIQRDNLFKGFQKTYWHRKLLAIIISVTIKKYEGKNWDIRFLPKAQSTYL